MSELKLCRICIRTQCKVYSYNKYQLKHFYEEVMAMRVKDNDGLPQYFCYECATMLHKFHKFKEKCYMGQKILKECSWKEPITYEIVYGIDRKQHNLPSPLQILTFTKRVKTYVEIDNSDDAQSESESIGADKVDVEEPTEVYLSDGDDLFDEAGDDNISKDEDEPVGIKTETEDTVTFSPKTVYVDDKKDKVVLEDEPVIKKSKYGLKTRKEMKRKRNDDDNQLVRRRIAYSQLLKLWEFLNTHREIASGFNKSTQDREHSKQMWKKASRILNRGGEGAIKSGPEWSKYWVDLKAKLKKKNRIIRDGRSRTGGGGSAEQELSEIELKFLRILGEDCGSGLPGVQVQTFQENQPTSTPGGSSQPTASDERSAEALCLEIDPLSEEASHLEVDSGEYETSDDVNQLVRRRVAYSQLLNLWEFLNTHREIASGNNKSTQDREHSKQMWKKASRILNRGGEGAIKSGPEWSKYWVDLKAKLKKKNRIIREGRSRTGGGGSAEQELSEIELKFLRILGEDCGSGLPGVQVQTFQENQPSSTPGGSSQPTASDERSAEVLYLEIDPLSEEASYLVVDSGEYEVVVQQHDEPNTASTEAIFLSSPQTPTPQQTSGSAPGRQLYVEIHQQKEPNSAFTEESVVPHRTSTLSPKIPPPQPLGSTAQILPHLQPSASFLPPAPGQSDYSRSTPAAAAAPQIESRNPLPQRTRRRQRLHRPLTAVAARAQLGAATEARAQAELTNRVLSDIASILRRIEVR